MLDLGGVNLNDITQSSLHRRTVGIAIGSGAGAGDAKGAVGNRRCRKGSGYRA